MFITTLQKISLSFLGILYLSSGISKAGDDQHCCQTHGFMNTSIQASPSGMHLHYIHNYINPKAFLGIEDLDLTPAAPVKIAIIDCDFDYHASTLYPVWTQSTQLDADQITNSKIAKRRTKLINAKEDHGTEVANILGGRNGLAPNALIKPILLSQGIAQAIRTATNENVDFINLSFHFNKGNENTAISKDIKNALREAKAKGIGIIKSAGNTSTPLGTTRYGKSLSKLAKKLDGHMILVGNTQYEYPVHHKDAPPKEQIRPSSNKAGKAYKHFICAPGSKHKTYGIGGRALLDVAGTSLSAPIVSASAVIIKGLYPELSNREVLSIIRHSARNRFLHNNHKMDKVIYGCGIVDLKAALEKAHRKSARLNPISLKADPVVVDQILVVDKTINDSAPFQNPASLQPSDSKFLTFEDIYQEMGYRRYKKKPAI